MEQKATTPSSSWGYAPMVQIAAAIAAGMVLDHCTGNRASAAIWYLGSGGFMLGWRRNWIRRHDGWAAAYLMASLLCLGGCWHHLRLCVFGGNEIGQYAQSSNTPACLEIMVRAAPRLILPDPENPLFSFQQQERTELEVAVYRVRRRSDWHDASGFATLYVTGNLSDLRPGDRLQAFVQIASIPGKLNPRDFDPAEFALARRQTCRLSAEAPECITPLHAAPGMFLRRNLEGLRSLARSELEASLSPETLPLAAALLLGVREDLDKPLVDAFFHTGTIHILSISGLHVGILGGFLFWLMRFGLMSRRAALTGVIVAVTFFAMVINAEAPAIRATVVIVLTCIALGIQRAGISMNSLAAAGCVVLAANPADLFRIGPQLSFLAMGAIVVFSMIWRRTTPEDPLERLIRVTRPWVVRQGRRFLRGISSALLLGAFIWGVTLPLVLWQFHIVSISGLIISVILSLPVAISLLSGVALILLAPLGDTIQKPFAWLCDLNLEFVERIILSADGWPASYFFAPGPDTWWVVGIYVILCGLLLYRAVLPWRWKLAIPAAWTALGYAVAIYALLSRDSLRCTIISVGHGTSVLVQLPTGENLLYDAGRMGSPTRGARSISNALWNHGVTKLDALILSHPDSDHYNAVPELISRFHVDRVWISPMFRENNDAGSKFVLNAIEAAEIPIEEISSSHRIPPRGECEIEILLPTALGVIGSDNANSIVLEISYQGRSLLLTGDVESPGLEELLSEEPRDCDVLLAPHHGSLRSNPPGVTEWCTPEWVVISGSRDDASERVLTAYEKSGASVLHTALDGAVEIELSDEGVRMQSFINGDENRDADGS